MPLPWPLVQFALNFLEELLRDVREVGALGNVLTDELEDIQQSPSLYIRPPVLQRSDTAATLLNTSFLNLFCGQTAPM